MVRNEVDCGQQSEPRSTCRAALASAKSDEMLNAWIRDACPVHPTQESPMNFSKAEIEAVIAASPRITVPFNKLSLSLD